MRSNRFNSLIRATTPLLHRFCVDLIMANGSTAALCHYHCVISDVSIFYFVPKHLDCWRVLFHTEVPLADSLLINYSFTELCGLVTVCPQQRSQWEELGRRCDTFWASLCFIGTSSHPKYSSSDIPWHPTLSQSPCPVLSPAPSSLELRDLDGQGAGKVQEEGSFLFGQEGGGDDVVDACWDVLHLHVAEATSGKRQRDSASAEISWEEETTWFRLEFIPPSIQTSVSFTKSKIIPWRRADGVYIKTCYLQRHLVHLCDVLNVLICAHNNSSCLLDFLSCVSVKLTVTLCKILEI